MANGALLLDEMVARKPGSQSLGMIACALLTVAVFTLDVLTPRDIAVPFLYALVAGTCLWWATSRQTVAIVAAISVLIVAGFFLGPEGRLWEGLVNDGIALLTLGLLAYSGVSYRSAVDKVQQRGRELTDFVENAAVGMYWIGLDGTILWANTEQLNMIGCNREEFVGHDIAEFHVDKPVIEDILGKLSSNAALKDYEARLRRKDGSVRDVLISSNFQRKEGQIVHARCYTRDVTDRERAERAERQSQDLTAINTRLQAEIAERKAVQGALLKAEQQYRELVDSVRAIVWRADARTFQFTFVSAQAETILGYPARRWLDEADFWQAHIHPDDREWAVAFCVRATAELRSHDFEYRMIAADGRTVWLRDLVKVEVEDGRPKELVGMMVDITRRREVEEKLRESEDRHRDLVEHSQDLICTHDLDGRILSVNPWAAQVLGYEQAELVTMNLRDILASGVRHEFDGYLAAIRKDGAAQGLMLVQPRAGEKRLWEYNNTLRTEGVSTPIVRGMAHDISERKRAERELQRQAALIRLLESLAAAANKADTPEQALAACLERICVYGGWNSGNVLQIARHGDAWRAKGTQWYFTDARARERFSDFITLSREKRLGNSGGIFTSHVIRTRAPQWIPDLGRVKTGPRLTCAKEAGVRAAFAFPVIVHDEVVACVEFFAAEVRAPDTALTEAAGDIASHLARVIERELSGKVQTQLAAIVETATVAIFTRTLDGTILSWNPGAEKMLGYTAAEAIGKPIAFTLPPGRPPNLTRNNEKLLRGEVVARESDRITKDGRVIDVLTSHSPVRDGAGNIVGASVILQDISALKQAQAAVRESEQRFRAIFDHAGVGIAMRPAYDRSQCWTHVNDSFCKMLGYTREELLERSTADITPADEQVPAMRDSKRLLSGEISNYAREKRVIRKDGRSVWVMLAVAAVPDAEGRPDFIIAIHHDITERKRAEEELRRSEEHFVRIFRSSPIAIGIGTANEGRLIDVNDRYLEFFGYERDEMIGRTGSELGLWADPNERAELLRQVKEHGTVRDFEAKFRRKSGEIAIGLYSREVVQFRGESVTVSMRVDITERKRAEDARTRYSNRLRALSRRLVEIQEAERRRLATELHDRIGQNLTALTINLSILSSQLSPQSAELHAPRLEDSRQLVEATIETVRSVISELRPTVLDDYGLRAALRWYGSQFEKRSGVLTSVEGEDLFPRPRSEVEAALYRIAQEALNNTLKHARAQRATLRLDADAARVTLTVTDDGAGFDPASVEQHGKHPGWGLLMMRERAESVGGRINVESIPAQGTRVVVEVDRRP